MFGSTKLQEFCFSLLLSAFLVCVVLFRWMSILLLVTNTKSNMDIHPIKKGSVSVRVRALPDSVWFENVVVLLVGGLCLQRVLQQSGDDLMGLALL